MARLSEKLALHAQRPVAPAGLDLTTRRDILTELRLEQIEPDSEQPRKELGDLSELSASIRELGVVQPIIVSVVGDDRYRILAGERRFSASRLAGLEKIPAIVRTVEEHDRRARPQHQRQGFRHGGAALRGRDEQHGAGGGGAGPIGAGRNPCG